MSSCFPFLILQGENALQVLPPLLEIIPEAQPEMYAGLHTEKPCRAVGWHGRPAIHSVREIRNALVWSDTRISWGDAAVSSTGWWNFLFLQVPVWNLGFGCPDPGFGHANPGIGQFNLGFGYPNPGFGYPCQISDLGIRISDLDVEIQDLDNPNLEIQLLEFPMKTG